MTATVSVLLPFRHAADTATAALESVLAQEGELALEVVAIEDRADPGTRAAVARVAAGDRRVRIVRAGAGETGIAAALRAGLSEARGQLIARMDADDLCRAGRLAAQVEALARDPRLGAVGTRVAGFPAGALGTGMQLYIEWQNRLVTAEDHAREIFIESPLCHPSVMIRRRALEEVGPWRDLDGPEDYDLWLRLDAAGWGLVKVPAVLLDWRHAPGRATFADPRYRREAFRELKAPHLARRVAALGRPLAVWGAGRTGKRLARALGACGVRARRFVDVAPARIGGVARGAPIVAPDRLELGQETIVVAVSARGARDEIRAHLIGAGFVEGDDFLCAA
jgi:GT2 family glycosyltransferase